MSFKVYGDEGLRKDEIYSCPRCSLVFNVTQGKKFNYEEYYKDNSRYINKDNGAKKYITTYNENMARTIKEIMELFPDKDAKILDIGCGRCTLLQGLHDAGYTNLTGIDPAMTDELAKQYPFRVQQGLLGKIPIPTTRFYDVIILSHVLEHVEDLRGAINNVYNLLEPYTGRVYIEVPNAIYYYRDFLPYGQYVDIEHIRHFSKTSLEELAYRGRLSVIEYKEKKVLVAGQVTYPACYIVAKTYNQNAIGSFVDYIRHTTMPTIVLNKPTIVFGTGSFIMRMLGGNRIKNLDNLMFFVDSNPLLQGRTLAGKDILSPEFLTSHMMTKEYDIIVASPLYQDEIREQILKMGISEYYIKMLGDYPHD
jgi:2-polyprenyl-3-methyl-5-hydroxy-6-metoxy-1,4-benzoquinol methylase